MSKTTKPATNNRFRIVPALHNYDVLRWMVIVVVLICLFGVAFLVLDLRGTALNFTDATPSTFNYFYFSLINFTTIGYGDIVPVSTTAKILAGVEGMVGYIMLGLFIVLVQRKI